MNISLNNSTSGIHVDKFCGVYKIFCTRETYLQKSEKRKQSFLSAIKIFIFLDKGLWRVEIFEIYKVNRNLNLKKLFTWKLFIRFIVHWKYKSVNILYLCKHLRKTWTFLASAIPFLKFNSIYNFKIIIQFLKCLSTIDLEFIFNNERISKWRYHAKRFIISPIRVPLFIMDLINLETS